MRRSRKIILSVLVVVLVLLVGGYWYERPLLLTGTGYDAHNACAVRTIADRDDPDDDLPPNPLVPLLRESTEGRRTTASILGVLAKQTAWSSPGFGCTLAEDRPELGAPTKVTTTNAIAGATAPDPTDDVEAALIHGFGDDLSAKWREELGTRGIVVVKNGRLVAERYAPGFDADTPQLGWSMAKSVTSLLVGRLVQQGEVGLDDDHLVKSWKDDRADITVRQLLQMTSGLAWDETYSLGTPITKMLYTEPDMGAYVADQELDHDPGRYLQYSSGSTTLLCKVLAPDHGGPDFPRRELFAPLGLRSAVLEPDAVGTPVCSSYLWATPRDWAAIGQFALADGIHDGTRLLPEGWMAETTKAVEVDRAEKDSEGYATGWWSNTGADGKVVEKALPADAYFAEGHDGQWLVVVPSEKLVVARLGFTPERDDDRAVSTAALLVEALHTPGG